MDGINLKDLRTTIEAGDLQKVYDEFQHIREAAAVAETGNKTDPRMLLRDETNFWVGVTVAFKYLKAPPPACPSNLR